jgi:hypothetical protein
MGLLDEAIREHLELKRRRGADPTEVERLEREALGPVRRIQAESAPGELSGMGDEAPDMVGEAASLGHDDDFLEEPELEYSTEHDYYAGGEPGPADESGETAAEHADVHGVVPPPEPMPAEEEPEPRASDQPVYEDPGVETAEYDVEAEHAREHAGDEGVLEETPEFLQDAPDHDRLWFEQRPPKDFDFDG